MTEKEAKIKVCRKSNLIGKVQNLEIYLDNKKIGSIRNGAEEIFVINPGAHNLSVKSEKWSLESQKITLDLVSGDTKNFECAIKSSSIFWLIGLVPAYIAAAILIWLSIGGLASFGTHIILVCLSGILALTTIPLIKLLMTRRTQPGKACYLREI